MRLLTTLALLLVVGGLGAFIFYHERLLPNSKQELVALRKPLAFDVSRADAIEITGKDLSVRLQRESNRWQVTAPVADRANQQLIKQLLAQLSETAWLETLQRADLKNDDWKRAGLDENTAVEVSVRAQKQTLAECKFGAASALEGTVYASTNLRHESTLIHVTNGAVAALLRRPADDWRDPKLLDLAPEGIKRFTLSAGSGVLEFARDANQPWRLVKPLQTRAADERVNGVLAALLHLEVKPQAPSHAPVMSENGTVPAMKISLEIAGMEKPVEITLQPQTSADAEPAVTVSDRAGFFSVPKKIADIWKLPLNVLRDQRLARLPKDLVDAVNIRSTSFPEVVLRKRGEGWFLKRRGADEPANNERVQKLIEGLNGVQVDEFSADAPTALAPFGLDQPFLQVEWQVAGKTHLLQFGQAEKTGVFAKYADEPFVYRLATNVFAVIPPDSVKWRGLAVLDLSIFSVHRIVISEGAKPSTMLDYDPNLASWRAEIAGKDVTPMLVRERADALLNRVSKLPAADWLSEHSEAYQALKNPTLSVQIHVADPRDADAEAKPLTIHFAPTAAGKDTAFYHGRVNNDPDTFLISREVYHQLIAPVVK